MESRCLGHQSRMRLAILLRSMKYPKALAKTSHARLTATAAPGLSACQLRRTSLAEMTASPPVPHSSGNSVPSSTALHAKLRPLSPTLFHLVCLVVSDCCSYSMDG